MPGKYNRKDHLYNKAKDEGYRSRAAFKLVELQKKYKLIKPGNRVLDLGCWPGGWLQVSSELVGKEGKVVGIDLVQTEALKTNNVFLICGDASDPVVQEKAIQIVGGNFDLILSDMSPKLSGISEVDQAASVACGDLALQTSIQCLRNGGTLIIKLFKGPEANAFRDRASHFFAKVNVVELDASRNTSNEFYFVGLGLRKG